jgi:8-oxo-dGTP pyrophosphatase MutT (NUDIX family)
VGVESSTQPRRRSIAAVALIRRRDAGQTVHLTQWNPKWQALYFVSGHKRPTETFRECIVREIGEELGLVSDVDCRLPDEPVGQLRFQAWSEAARTFTSYEFAIYEVTLTGDSALAKIMANPDNRWVTEAEILAGLCTDGTRISPTMTRVLTALSQDRS